jgi:hypothetical protein
LSWKVEEDDLRQSKAIVFAQNINNIRKRLIFLKVVLADYLLYGFPLRFCVSGTGLASHSVVYEVSPPWRRCYDESSSPLNILSRWRSGS